MTVKSKIEVLLPNEVYCGIWQEFVLTIPFVDRFDKDYDLEIPTSKGTPTPKKVLVEVFNNVATFEEN
jgi:hypothetical protein